MSIIDEFVERHTDAEVHEQIYKTLLSVARTYKVSYEKELPEYCWTAAGDFDLALGLITRLYKRDQERLARAKEQ